ncbi:GT2 family glycosyltransferase [Agrobacterium vitis]|nr:GT2 family glycosyltransferase [Agrobacterium vitis]MBE1438010.1 GT2 family glycosyltransferase [Agrobacterium vitis]
MRDELSLMDVTVVSVCYNSSEVIGGLIDSLPQAVSLVLVDNGGTNNFPTFAPERKVTIVRMTENEGFGRGCNAGAAAASTPYLFFLNPDVRLEKGAIEALLHAARQYPNAAAFNPRLINSDGSAYFKRRSYLIPRSHYLKRGWPDDDCEVPVLSGAAIFVKRDHFEALGGFDPQIFLYHEDDDLSLRLKTLGPLMFVRDSGVVHAKGYSSGRSSKVAFFKAFHMAQSRIYAGKKHHRPMPLLSAALHCVVSSLLPFNWFSSRRRAKLNGFRSGVYAVFKRDYLRSSLSGSD